MYSAGFDLYLLLVEDVTNLMSAKGLSFQGTALNIFVNRSGGNGWGSEKFGSSTFRLVYLQNNRLPVFQDFQLIVDCIFTDS